VRIGLHALGIGAGAQPEVIRAVASAAEAVGFARLWVGEHVVMVDRSGSRYPYNEAEEIPVPADADWLDPFVCLSFAAAMTSSIELATGILLLPEHHPVVVAKRAASLDLVSGGRFTLGVGVGWSREEFEALGVPFAQRGARTAEYVAALRELWRHDPASFQGEFVSFDSVRVNPKPVRDGHLPVIVGGNSEPALARVARVADGWYGFNLRDLAEVERCLGSLGGHCHAPWPWSIASPDSWGSSSAPAWASSWWSTLPRRTRTPRQSGCGSWGRGGWGPESPRSEAHPAAREFVTT